MAKTKFMKGGIEVRRSLRQRVDEDFEETAVLRKSPRRSNSKGAGGSKMKPQPPPAKNGRKGDGLLRSSPRRSNATAAAQSKKKSKPSPPPLKKGGNDDRLLRSSPRRSNATAAAGSKKKTKPQPPPSKKSETQPPPLKKGGTKQKGGAKKKQKRDVVDIGVEGSETPPSRKGGNPENPRRSSKRKRDVVSSPSEIEDLTRRDEVEDLTGRYEVEDLSTDDEDWGAICKDDGKESDDDEGDSKEAEGDSKEAEEDEADDGYDGMVEESCRDLSLFVGEVAGNDDYEDDEDNVDDDDVWAEEKVPDPLSSDEENEDEMRPAEAYREDTAPEEMLRLGKLFSDVDDFKHACLRYTLKTRKNIKYYKSSAFKVAAKCAAVAKPEDPPCPWMIYCSFDKRKQKLMVKTFVDVHKCETTGESKILKRSAIANLFAERLRLNPKITAKHMEDEIRREYEMIVSENSCIKAKTKLMNERKKGHEYHFDRIWNYQAEILRSNPGSTVDIETIPGATIGSKQRFYRMYICFQSQRESWKQTCRPVIGLDGAFLKWDIKGQLLAAVGRDGDNRIVPIAWAVVEIENDTNWEWFVQHLATDLGLGDGKEYTIMSDKQKGLVKAIHSLLPEAEHRQCCRHIYENWRKGGTDLRLQRLFWYIARSYTPGLYKHNMDALKEYNAGAHASLLRTQPETWSRAFFRLGSLCNDNLNNLSGSFNRTIRQARKKPLLDMLEEIRIQCMTRNYKRSKLANRLNSKFTKKTHKELDRIEQKSTQCELRWAIGPETEVDYKGHSYVVSMEHQTCACRSWQMNGIPCIHAAKVILAMKKKLSDFVAPCYTTTRWRETYSYGIKPVNGVMEWPETNRLGVVPPPWRNGNPGRPRNHDRIKGKNETGSKTKVSRANRIMTCSKCKEEGHNKLTCKNDAVESPPKRPRGRPRKNQVLQCEDGQDSEPPLSFTHGRSSQGQTSDGQPSQGQASQGQASQGQSSRWDQNSQDQASQTRGWGRWFN